MAGGDRAIRGRKELSAVPDSVAACQPPPSPKPPHRPPSSSPTPPKGNHGTTVKGWGRGSGVWPVCPPEEFQVVAPTLGGGGKRQLRPALRYRGPGISGRGNSKTQSRGGLDPRYYPQEHGADSTRRPAHVSLCDTGRVSQPGGSCLEWWEPQEVSDVSRKVPRPSQEPRGSERPTHPYQAHPGSGHGVLLFGMQDGGVTGQIYADVREKS